MLQQRLWFTTYRSCEGRYDLPPFLTLPYRWPFIGWTGEATEALMKFRYLTWLTYLTYWIGPKIKHYQLPVVLPALLSLRELDGAAFLQTRHCINSSPRDRMLIPLLLSVRVRKSGEPNWENFLANFSENLACTIKLIVIWPTPCILYNYFPLSAWISNCQQKHAKESDDVVGRWRIFVRLTRLTSSSLGKKCIYKLLLLI